MPMSGMVESWHCAMRAATVPSRLSPKKLQGCDANVRNGGKLVLRHEGGDRSFALKPEEASGMGDRKSLDPRYSMAV